MVNSKELHIGGNLRRVDELNRLYNTPSSSEYIKHIQVILDSYVYEIGEDENYIRKKQSNKKNRKYQKNKKTMMKKKIKKKKTNTNRRRRRTNYPRLGSNTPIMNRNKGV